MPTTLERQNVTFDPGRFKTPIPALKALQVFEISLFPRAHRARGLLQDDPNRALTGAAVFR